MKKRVCSLGAIALMAGLAVSSSAWAADFPETEANDTKGAANAAGPLVPGDTISGNSTGASTTVAGAASADNFLLTVAAPPSSGIWRYRMVISTTGTAGHIGTLRGLTAGAGAVNAGTDATIQTTSTTTTPARFNQWYGLGGGQTQVFYRVAGAAATTDNYVSTLERTAVTPVDVVGSVAPGTVLIRPDVASQNAYDTDFWVYDSNFDPIPQGGRDDPDGTGVVVSLSPGTYYVGIGNFNTANNQANSLAADFLTGGVMDFGRVVAGASSTAGTGAVNMGIEILDGGGTSVLATGSDAPLGGAATAFDVRWFRMVVAVPTGPTLSNCLVSPNQVSAGGSVTFTSTAALGTGGGTITSVTADLTTLGGGAAVPMTPLGGNNFSLNHNIPGGQGTGSFPVTMTATDSNNLTGSCNVNVQVLGANDLCAGASVVSVGTTAGDNAAATTDGTSSCTTSSKDLWYSFTSVSGGSFVIDTEGSTQGDTVLNVFDVCGGTELACDDDGGTGLLSSLLISLTPNQTIIIRVASFGGAPAGGPFNLNINSAVSGACCNDLTGACTLVTNGICATGATYQGDNTVCAPSPCPASGSCCDPAGGTCLLRIQAQCASPSVWTSGEVCTPNPCPQPPPPSNDTCATAIVVNGNNTGSAATQFAQNENDEPGGSCNTTTPAGIDNSVWFTFNSSTGGQLTGTVDTTNYDGVAVLFTGSCGAGTLVEVACWDEPDNPMDLSLPESGSSVLSPNTNYFLVVGDWGVADGGGALTWDITVPGTSGGNGRCCIGARCAIVASSACLGAGSAGASFTPSVNDCNASGVFNTPCCFADYNHAGGVTVQDIFDFLTDWFSGSINANVSGDGIAAPTVQDIFDFLTAWFSGC